MSVLRLRTFAFAATAAVALTGCSSYDDYGYGRGYASYRTYYPSSYYGWYDNYYYPGVGVYLYDRSGARHRWSDSHRRYWQGWRGERRENWSGYGRDRRGDGYRGEGRRGRR